MSQHDRSAEELQHEIDRTRSRIDSNLTELQGKLSPGELLDSTLGYMKEGGRATLGNLTRSVRDNPLPAVMLGVSVAWLMMGPPRHRAPRLDGDLSDAIERGTRAAEAVRDSAGRGAEAARAGAAQIADAGRRTAEAARGTAAALRDRAQRGAQEVGEAGRRTAAAARDAKDFLAENPLVMGLVGVSLGAALGALALSTPRGRELTEAARTRIAEAADSVRQGVSDAADTVRQGVAEGTEKAKESYQQTRHAVVKRVTGRDKDDDEADRDDDGRKPPTIGDPDARPHGARAGKSVATESGAIAMPPPPDHRTGTH